MDDEIETALTMVAQPYAYTDDVSQTAHRQLKLTI